MKALAALWAMIVISLMFVGSAVVVGVWAGIVAGIFRAFLR